MRKSDTTNTFSYLIGADAPTAYCELALSFQELTSVTVCRYQTPPLLQERISIGEVEQGVIDAALLIRESVQIPFWEALFAACLRDGKHLESLLDAAGFHNGPGELTAISAQELRAGQLATFIAGAENRNVGLTSRVVLGENVTYHLALMDFHCIVSESNAELVAGVC